MNKTQYKELLKKYLNNELSADELADFLALTEANEDSFLEETGKIKADSLKEDFPKEQIFRNIMAHPDFTGQHREVKKMRFSSLLRVAAVLIAFGAFSLTAYFYIQRFLSKPEEAYSTNIVTKDNVLLSGKESVMMTLADGTTMTLDEAALNRTIEKDGMIIKKGEKGEVMLSLTDNHRSQSNQSGTHIFSTPKGEGFAFVLPDGSKVRLNSSTKISIPANFNEGSREISLEGEAFFDVAHNASKPFKIHTGKDEIRVLGTAFNVKAYSADRQIFTTLVRGSVSVSTANKNLLLSPGEQSFSDPATGNLTKKKVDVDQFIGWMNGYFKFVDEPVQGILNELMKWYDIKEVRYETKNTEKFTASIKRSKSLAEVLKNIQGVSDLQFIIEEGRIVVKDK